MTGAAPAAGGEREGFPGETGHLPLLLAVFLTLVMLGGIIDLVLDRPTTWRSWHVAFELAMVLMSATFAVVLFRAWHRASRALTATRASLAASAEELARRQAERDHWRRSAEQALRGLSQAIDGQFVAWGLTNVEREIALLLLKGAGHKQAAAQLQRSERTVRQHAVDIYRKAGVQGRAELAAFFLQDLGTPTEDPGSQAPRA